MSPSAGMTDSPTPEITDELIAEARRSGALPDDMPKWMASAITRIDAFSRRIGAVVCWLTVALFSAMVIEIFLRYVFTAPTLWAYDISRMLGGALFMLGAGYALSRGVHIRADFIYRNLSPRTQGLIDSVLYLVFYFPALTIFFWVSAEFAYKAWDLQETASDSAWAPYLWPIKSAMPLGILFLLIQGISELLKSYYAATRGRLPFKTDFN